MHTVRLPVIMPMPACTHRAEYIKRIAAYRIWPEPDDLRTLASADIERTPHPSKDRQDNHADTEVLDVLMDPVIAPCGANGEKGNEDQSDDDCNRQCVCGVETETCLWESSVPLWP